MTSGYFLEAKKHHEPLADFLKQYPEELRKGDFLHLGTHPPGLILLYQTLDSICSSSPALCSVLNKTEPYEVTQAMMFLKEQGTISKSPDTSTLISISELDRNVLWLRMLLGSVLIGCLPLGIYLILRQTVSATTSWYFASYSIFLPGVTCFFPKSDTLYPASAMFIIFTACFASQQKKPLFKILLLILSGFILSFSLCFSLALLPIGLVLGLWLLLNTIFLTHSSNRILQLIFFEYVPLCLGFLAIPLFFGLFYQVNLFEIWILNLKNHAAFYNHNDRSYLGWLILNLLEITLTLGFPVVAVIFYQLSKIRELWSKLISSPLGTLSCSTLIIWSLLWLSGKNMGEAMRLWIFWSPLMILVSAFGYSHLFNESATNKEHTSQTQQLLSTMLLCQIIICILTSSRIDSFGFTNFFK